MLLVYDGECGFCIRSARWIEARLPRRVRVEPWQQLELGALGLTRQDVETAVWWLEGSGPDLRRWRGADAIGRALATSSGAWRVIGRLILRPPVRWLAHPVYTLIAANRHRIPTPR